MRTLAIVSAIAILAGGCGGGSGCAEERFHYVDAAGKPRGPVSRAELETLRQDGTLLAETSVLRGSDQTWTTLGELGA